MKKIFIPGLGERKKDYKGRIDWCYPIDWNNPKLKFKDVRALVAFSLGGVLAINHAAKYRINTLILIDVPEFYYNRSRLKVTNLIKIKAPTHYVTKKIIRQIEKLILL